MKRTRERTVREHATKRVREHATKLRTDNAMKRTRERNERLE